MNHLITILIILGVALLFWGLGQATTEQLAIAGAIIILLVPFSLCYYLIYKIVALLRKK